MQRLSVFGSKSRREYCGFREASEEEGSSGQIQGAGQGKSRINKTGVCVCGGGSPGLAKGRDGRILGVFRGQSQGRWVEVKRQWVSGLRFPL